jgi:secreted trypsin-like serine protease
MRIGLPVAAAGVAAAIAAALLTTSAGAATAAPEPVAPVTKTASQAELKQRIAGVMADGATAPTTGNTALSSSTTSGTVDPKIIGGSTTTINSAPWMAQLFWEDGASDQRFFCGGAVIAPTKILTAAHCVDGYDWVGLGAVVTGTSNMPDSAGNTDGTVTGIVRQWSHPGYSTRTIDNDIAILTLATPVTATPIRMTTSTDTASYAAGTSAKLYGWGRISSTNQDISPVLKTATLPIQSDTTCANYYGAHFIKGHMICAGTPATGSDAGTTSACNGDSGGPLVVGGRIVGVVSWGVVDCVQEGAYSVFSKVRTYVGPAYSQVEDANMSYTDNRADLFVRNSSTKTGYELDSKGTTLAARQSLGYWGAYNLVTQTDLDRDGVRTWSTAAAPTVTSSGCTTCAPPRHGSRSASPTTGRPAPGSSPPVT